MYKDHSKKTQHKSSINILYRQLNCKCQFILIHEHQNIYNLSNVNILSLISAHIKTDLWYY